MQSFVAGDTRAPRGIVMQAVPRELAPAAAEPGRARDPQHGLQVAQAAGAFLDVGLEVVRGVVVLEWRCCCSSAFASKNVRASSDAANAPAEPRVRARARRRAWRCSSRLVRTVTSAAISVAHSSTVRTAWRELEADVPQRGEEALDAPSCRGVGRSRQQHQHVDVGVRVELRRGRSRRRRAARCRRACRPRPRRRVTHAVDEPRVLAQQPRRVGIVEERGASAPRGRGAARCASRDARPRRQGRDGGDRRRACGRVDARRLDHGAARGRRRRRARRLRRESRSRPR